MELLSPRESQSLTGLWQFQIDRNNIGRTEQWQAGSTAHWDDKLYVPGNWNGQNSAYEWYTGVGWYAYEFYLPTSWEGKAVHLHFGGVSYACEAWLNGTPIGTHEGEFLPFDFRIEKFAKFGTSNKLVMRVDNTLTPQTIPALDFCVKEGGELLPGTKIVGSPYQQYLDVFHYGGIYKDVNVYCTSHTTLEDITIRTKVDGIIQVLTEIVSNVAADHLAISYQIEDESGVLKQWVQKLSGTEAITTVESIITLPNPKLWCPAAPHLYQLTVTLSDETARLDAREESFGIREVKVESNQLLLNGETIFLKGVGSIEDFPVLGRGVNGVILRKDVALLQNLGANFHRIALTCAREEHLALANRFGLMMMEDVAWLQSDYSDPVVLEKMKAMLTAQMKRDKNNPSIIMWSIQNEPLSQVPSYRNFLKELVALAKELDPTRPVTYVSCEYEHGDRNFDLVDIICHTSYKGWYTQYGDIPAAIKALNTLVGDIEKEYPEKPIFWAGFGADAYEGLHSDPPEMWTEEYQAELLRRTWQEVLLCHENIIGGSIIELCDYRSPQNFRRLKHQKKGLYTKDRTPKYAAHIIKQLYHEIDDLKPTRMKEE